MSLETNSLIELELFDKACVEESLQSQNDDDDDDYYGEKQQQQQQQQEEEEQDENEERVDPARNVIGNIKHHAVNSVQKFQKLLTAVNGKESRTTFLCDNNICGCIDLRAGETASSYGTSLATSIISDVSSASSYDSSVADSKVESKKKFFGTRNKKIFSSNKSQKSNKSQGTNKYSRNPRWRKLHWRGGKCEM